MSGVTGYSLWGALNAFQGYFNNTRSVDATTKANQIQETVALPSIEDLKGYSLQAFGRFEDVWDFDKFWIRANTCDAAVCLAEKLLDRWPEDQKVKELCESVCKMLRQNLEYFKNTDLPTEWADDFVWWGLMGTNAYKLLKRLGEKDLAQQYLNLSVELCWEYMLSNAYDNSPNARPVPKGCKNNDANDTDDGVKNTVVNAGLLLLSTRLYRLYLQEGLPDRDRFLDMAYSQWEWFSSWFRMKKCDYLKPLNAEDGALIQERPLDFVDGSDYQKIDHPNWSPGWVWSSDQGFLAEGLRDLLVLKDDLGKYLQRTHPEIAFDGSRFKEEVKNIIHKLVQGIQKALIWEKDGIFREAPCATSFTRFGDDYAGGLGDLARCLDFNEIKAQFGVDFHANIMATVDALWSTKDKDTYQFKREFTVEANDLAYIKQFNSLWGMSDQVTVWSFSDNKLRDGVCQALGMDYLSAALSIK